MIYISIIQTGFRRNLPCILGLRPFCLMLPDLDLEKRERRPPPGDFFILPPPESLLLFFLYHDKIAQIMGGSRKFRQGGPDNIVIFFSIINIFHREPNEPPSRSNWTHWVQSLLEGYLYQYF